MRKNFVFNFIISFIIYAAVDIIEFLTFDLFAPSTGRLWSYIRDLFFKTPFGSFLFVCIYILLSIFLPIVIYILIGSKLKQLGNHLLNYLSISSSFIFLMIIGALIFFEFILKYGFYYFYLIFGYFTIYIFYIIEEDNILLYFILSIIPSVLIWLGMIYKSIRSKNAIDKNL